MCESKVEIVREGKTERVIEEVTHMEVDYETHKVILRTEDGDLIELSGYRRITSNFLTHVTRIELS